ncbi:hypothetical protein FocnCong_v012535 [Fusarium oxysporum f. sp. conglutinans]|nr:hypothetical protein FocnCong_v012535 [Fusarium oxysporum f. sp. conglutinans]
MEGMVDCINRRFEKAEGQIIGLKRALEDKDRKVSQATKDLESLTKRLQKRQEVIEDLDEKLRDGNRNTIGVQHPETRLQTEIHVNHVGSLFTDGQSRSERLELSQANHQIQYLQEVNKKLTEDVEALLTSGGSQQHVMDVSPLNLVRNIQGSRPFSFTEKDKAVSDLNEIGSSGLRYSRQLPEPSREIRNLKNEIKEDYFIIKPLTLGLHDHEKHRLEQSLEHGSIREERDALQSTLDKLQETVKKTGESIILEGGHHQLVVWVENQVSRYHAAEKRWKTLQSQQEKLKEERERMVEQLRKEKKDHLTVQEERDTLKAILSSQLRTAMEDLKDHKRQTKGPAKVKAEEPQMIDMSLKNDETNIKGSRDDGVTERPVEVVNLKDGKETMHEGLKQLLNPTKTSDIELTMAHATTPGAENVTEGTYRTRLLDTYSVTTLTTHVDKALGVIFERHNREIESMRNELQILQKQLGNIEGRLDTYIDMLRWTDSLDFTITWGDQNVHGRIVNKLGLLMSEKFRGIGFETSQPKAGISEGAKVEIAGIMCDMKAGNNSSPQLCQPTSYSPDSGSKSTKFPPPTTNHATEQFCVQTNPDEVVDGKIQPRGTGPPKQPNKPRRAKGRTVEEVLGTSRVLRPRKKPPKNSNLGNVGHFHVTFRS